MTERRAMTGIAIALVGVNVLLMLRAVPPYDMLYAAHRQVGLGYSSLMVLAALAAALLQAFALRAVLRGLGVFRQPPAAPPAAADAPAVAPHDGVYWLPHHDLYAKVLRLDTRQNTRHLHTRSEAPALSRGWFVEVEGALAGVYATPTGPVFFLDGNSHTLSHSDRASVTEGRRRNSFTLQAGAEQISLSYQPPGDLHVGDMDADPFHKDFFHWLAESLPDADFHSYYTLAPAS